MARFAQIDSQIRTSRLILASRFKVPELNPFFFANRASKGLKIVNRRFEAIRANRSHVKIVFCFFLRIDSCESLKGSLLQNGFCTKFSDFDAKSCSPKNAPNKRTEERTEKRTEKRNVFTEFFHRIFPRIFGVCFSAVRTVNATEKRPPNNSARKSIAAQNKIQSADVVGVGSLSPCPFEKQKLSRKT